MGLALGFVGFGGKSGQAIHEGFVAFANERAKHIQLKCGPYVADEKALANENALQRFSQSDVFARIECFFDFGQQKQKAEEIKYYCHL
jgi:hypothetical protein